MTTYAGKDALFTSRLPTDDVDVPGVGTVKVRGLSRAEVLKARSQVRSIPDAIARQAQIERKLLAMGMVEPALTEDEVKQWQRACPAGELEVVTDRIQELSGMKDAEAMAKEVYRAMEADPETEFRVPPGE